MWIVSLILLILAVVAYSKMASLTANFTSAVDSWQETPITDVYFNLGGVCLGSDGAVSMKGTSSSWPGTYDACDCNDSAKFKTSSRRLCNSTELDKTTGKCKDAPGLPAADLYMYPNNTVLCVSRSGVHAIDRPSVSVSGNSVTCPSGFTLCGGNATSTGNSTKPGQFCAKGAQCPLTDLRISTSNADIGADQVVSFTFGSRTVYIHKKRGGLLNTPADANTVSGAQVGLPITSVYIQRNRNCLQDGCGYSTSSYTFPSGPVTLGSNTRGYDVKSFCSGGCSDSLSGFAPSPYFDTRVVTIDQVSETEVYSYTGLAYLDSISGAFRPVSSNTYVYLQYRAEILWTPECPRTRLDGKNTNPNVLSVTKAQLAAMIFAIIFFLVLDTCDMLGHFIESVGEYAHSKTFKYLKYLSYLIKIIVFIISAAYASYTFGFWDDISKQPPTFYSAGCTDKLTNDLIGQLRSSLQDVSANNIVNSVLSGGQGLLSAAQVLFKL